MWFSVGLLLVAVSIITIPGVLRAQETWGMHDTVHSSVYSLCSQPLSFQAGAEFWRSCCFGHMNEGPGLAHYEEFAVGGIHTKAGPRRLCELGLGACLLAEWTLLAGSC